MTEDSPASQLVPGDEGWRDEKALVAELSTLNTHVSRYVLRLLDFDAGRAEQMSIEDERGLAARLAGLAAVVQERAERREALGELPPLLKGKPSHRRLNRGGHPPTPAAAQARDVMDVVAVGLAVSLILALTWVILLLLANARRKQRQQQAASRTVTVVELVERALQQGEPTRLNWSTDDLDAYGRVRPSANTNSDFPTAIFPPIRNRPTRKPRQ